MQEKLQEIHNQLKVLNYNFEKLIDEFIKKEVKFIKSGGGKEIQIGSTGLNDGGSEK